MKSTTLAVLALMLCTSARGGGDVDVPWAALTAIGRPWCEIVDAHATATGLAVAGSCAGTIAFDIDTDGTFGAITRRDIAGEFRETYASSLVLDSGRRVLAVARYGPSGDVDAGRCTLLSHEGGMLREIGRVSDVFGCGDVRSGPDGGFSVIASSLNGNDVVVSVLNESGGERWRRRIEGRADAPFPRFASTTSAGGIWVLSTVRGRPAGEWSLQRYDASGSVEEQRTILLAPDELVRAVAVAERPYLLLERPVGNGIEARVAALRDDDSLDARVIALGNHDYSDAHFLARSTGVSWGIAAIDSKDQPRYVVGEFAGSTFPGWRREGPLPSTITTLAHDVDGNLLMAWLPFDIDGVGGVRRFSPAGALLDDWSSPEVPKRPFAIVPQPDGAFITAGSDLDRAVATAIDDSGNRTWRSETGPQPYAFGLSGIDTNTDHGMTIATSPQTPFDQHWLQRLDASGTTIATRVVQAPELSIAAHSRDASMLFTSDGGQAVRSVFGTDLVTRWEETVTDDVVTIVGLDNGATISLVRSPATSDSRLSGRAPDGTPTFSIDPGDAGFERIIAMSNGGSHAWIIGTRSAPPGLKHSIGRVDASGALTVTGDTSVQTFPDYFEVVALDGEGDALQLLYNASIVRRIDASGTTKWQSTIELGSKGPHDFELTTDGGAWLFDLEREDVLDATRFSTSGEATRMEIATGWPRVTPAFVAQDGGLLFANTVSAGDECRIHAKKYDTRGHLVWTWRQRADVPGCHQLQQLAYDDGEIYAIGLSPRANEPRTLTIYKVTSPIFDQGFE